MLSFELKTLPVASLFLPA